MGEFVDVEASGRGVATIRLDHPSVNALNEQVVDDLGAAVERARADDDVRAVVVWGGPRIFSAGANVGELSTLDPASAHRYIGRWHEAFTRLEHLPKITVAAINGYALGGGCELTLACDLRVGAEDARLGQPEVLLGIIPGAGGTQRLPRLIGMGRAKELIYSGRQVRADEALAIGLLNRVVPAAEVHERAVELAGGFARGPTAALAEAKLSVQQGADVDLAAGLAIEQRAFARLFATEDRRIGMHSFLERGPGKARFIGR